MAGWKPEDGKPQDKKPVKNQDLWQEPDEEPTNWQWLITKRIWVKGHADNRQETSEPTTSPAGNSSQPWPPRGIHPPRPELTSLQITKALSAIHLHRLLFRLAATSTDMFGNGHLANEHQLLWPGHVQGILFATPLEGDLQRCNWQAESGSPEWLNMDGLVPAWHGWTA